MNVFNSFFKILHALWGRCPKNNNYYLLKVSQMPNTVLSILHNAFSKLYFIDHAITVVLIIPPLPLSSQLPSFPQAVLTPLSMPMGHGQVLWLLYFLYYITHDCSVTNYLYFLIPSPLHPFPFDPMSQQCGLMQQVSCRVQ